MNEAITIAPIVEGVGEVQAIPTLVRRICTEILGLYDVDVRKPWRLPRAKMVKVEELSRTTLVSGHGIQNGGILIVLDQDDDACAIELAQSLLHQQLVRVPIEVVVATREYEAWFLAAIESLRVHRAIRDDAAYAHDPESPRDAKGRLEAMMTEHYRETIHQVAFSSCFDLTESQNRSRSFRRMVSAVERLCSHKTDGEVSEKQRHIPD